MQEIFQAIQANGGVPYIVGGYVRDHIMGKQPKDMDVEVYQMQASRLIRTLQNFGRVDTVGASFGVIKLTTAKGQDFDFSLPRRDNKVGQGHRGFMVEVDPTMTVNDAAARRDFTMNAISMTHTGEIVDPHGGKQDLADRVLRHTSPAFAEDPLRVLRGFQFAGRFDMSVADETAKLCRELRDEYQHLAKERIWGEWYKWAAKSIKPSAGLEFLYRTGWIRLYPEITALIGLQQDPIWHPEKSAYIHTKYVCDAAADIAQRDSLSPDDRAALVFGALCHDFGKATTTAIINGRITSHGHDQAGVPMAESFMRSIGAPNWFVGRAMELTKHHMAHVHGEPTARTARRLIASLEYTTPDQVIRVMEADHSGRPPLPKILPPAAQRLAELISEVAGEVAPIMQGRHLIEMGMKPGPRFGQILREVYQRQLDGEITNLDQALAFVRSMQSSAH